MFRLKLMVLALASLGLVACAGDDVSRGTTSAYAAEFQGLDIRRIGNDRVGNREFQNRAILNGLQDLEAHGIGRDRIEGITVSTSGGELSRSSIFPTIGRTFTYDVWYKIKGCESSVLYRAGPTGGITTSNDTSGCLGSS